MIMGPEQGSVRSPISRVKNSDRYESEKDACIHGFEAGGKPDQRFAPQLHESAGGLPKTKLVLHSCSLTGSTSAMEVSIPIAFVLPDREHECNESFKLGRLPALS
ncbi:hypothetical protein Tco_0255309 [Tanacetum coccineum]